MKKAFSMLLMLALCLSLCAFTNNKAIKEVESLIDAIGEVTVDSEDAVLSAEKAYDSLTAEEKDKVTNHTVLTQARTTLDEALHEQYVAELYASVSGEWVNINEMDRYVFHEDGTGMHGNKAIEFTIDPEKMLLSVTEGVSLATTQDFGIDLEYKTPRLIALYTPDYYVEAENYDAIAEQLRAEYTEILTGYEYWSSTRGLNYIMFGESGGGYFLLSGVTLGMQWEWVDNNTIKASFEYSGTTYSNELTITNSSAGAYLVDDQDVIQYKPKNKLK